MLCGARRSSAMAAWGRHEGTRIAQAPGFTPATPCAATPHTICRHVHRDACEAHLGTWADEVVGRRPPGPETPAPARAREGKTLRGSKTQGAPGRQRLSALAHQVGGTLAPPAVDEKPHAIPAVEPILPPGVREGRRAPMDALLPQRHLAQTMVDKGGDEVMIVQENQPQLRADSAWVLTRPPVGA